MYHLAVCDDERTHAQALVELLHQGCWDRAYQIQVFSGPLELLGRLEDGYSLNVLMMDIELDGKNGIDVVKTIRQSHPQMVVIYVTGYCKYCMDVYETLHTFFMVKPATLPRLNQAMALAERDLAAAGQGHLLIRQSSGTVTLPLGSVHYIESDRRKVRIYASEEVYELYGSLSDYAGLPEGRFVRCHQSYIINLSAAAGMEKDAFLLTGGQRIPISKSRLTESRRAFLLYMGGVV